MTVGVGVSVMVALGVTVAVSVGVIVGVSVGVCVVVADAVAVGVNGVAVCVGVALGSWATVGRTAADCGLFDAQAASKKMNVNGSSRKFRSARL